MEEVSRLFNYGYNQSPDKKVYIYQVQKHADNQNITVWGKTELFYF